MSVNSQPVQLVSGATVSDATVSDATVSGATAMVITPDKFRIDINNRILSISTLLLVFINMVNTKCSGNRVAYNLKELIDIINNNNFINLIVDLKFVVENTVKQLDTNIKRDNIEVKKRIVNNLISIINNNKSLIDSFLFHLDNIMEALINADDGTLECIYHSILYIAILDDNKIEARSKLGFDIINKKLTDLFANKSKITYNELILDVNSLQYSTYINNNDINKKVDETKIIVKNKLCTAIKETSALQLHKWNLELYKFLSLLFPALTAIFELDDTSVSFIMYVGDILKKLFIIIKKLTIFGVNLSYYFDKKVCESTDLKLTKFSLQVYQLFKYYYINFINYTVVFNNFKNKFTNINQILDDKNINKIILDEKLDNNITVKVTTNPFFPRFEGLTNTSKKDNRVCLVLLIAILIVILLYIKLKN